MPGGGDGRGEGIFLILRGWWWEGAGNKLKVRRWWWKVVGGGGREEFFFEFDTFFDIQFKNTVNLIFPGFKVPSESFYHKNFKTGLTF